MHIVPTPHHVIHPLFCAETLLAVAFLITSACRTNMAVYAQPVPMVLRAVPMIRMVAPALPSIERGLWVDSSNGLQSVAVIDGKKIVVATGANHRELNNAIEQRRLQKISQIQNVYGVIISRAGDVFCSAANNSCLTREPLLAELLSLEFALSRSNPLFTTQRKKSKTLRFCFLSQPNVVGALACWSFDVHGRPVIAIEPDMKSHFTLESTLLHELAHHSQYCLGLNLNEFGSWKTGVAAGWHHFQNPGTGEIGWSMRTKDKRLFKLACRCDHWVRCNEKGQPLNSEGIRVLRQADAEKLSSAEIVRLAMVRPATNYFCNPAEVLAEGMMLYRLNEDSRSYLMHASPELYELVKSENQRELEKTSGARTKSRACD